jgi:hypothetical protein
VHESVLGVFLVRNVSGYAVCVCLKHGAAVTAGVVSLLAHRLRRLLVRLLRRHDDLLQTITLLVGAAVLHLRHRLLYVSEPRVSHFCLTARNKTHTRPRTEIPLASIRMNVVHDLELGKGLVRCDKNDF